MKYFAFEPAFGLALEIQRLNDEDRCRFALYLGVAFGHLVYWLFVNVLANFAPLGVSFQMPRTVVPSIRPSRTIS